MKYSYASVVMPSGIGTLDELFAGITLIQTKLIEDFPIVIFDSKYYKELIEHIQLMTKNESINPENMNLLFITDSAEEVAEHLKVHAIKKFGLVKTQYKPKWWYDKTKEDSKSLSYGKK